VAGAAVERMLAARPGEPLRRAALRTAGRRAFRFGLAGAALAGVEAVDAAVGGRRPGLRVLAAGGGLLAGTALAGWQIYRYHSGGEADPARLGPVTDPLTGQTAGRGAAPDQLPLPPVAKSLLLALLHWSIVAGGRLVPWRRLARLRCSLASGSRGR
jgi:hypothetical protein